MIVGYAELIKDLVSTIHANIKELRERRNFADPEELNYIEGKLQAYSEIISALKSSAKEFGVPTDQWNV